MKRLTLLTITMMMVCLYADAQKDTIAAASFECTGDYCSYVPMVYEAVTNTMSSTGRFIFLDRSKADALASERTLEVGATFVESPNAGKVSDIGANYVVTGAVSLRTIPTNVELKDNNGRITGYKTVYNAYATIALKTINVHTGQVVSSRTINKNNNYAGGMMSGMIGMSSNTPEQAVTKLVGDLKKSREIRQWIGETFPITVQVLKVIDADKKIVLVSGGSENGLSEKTEVRIVSYDPTPVNGKILNRTVEVAMGKVQKVEDGNFAEVKVKGNWDEVVKNIDSGHTLSVITTNLK